MFRCGIGRVKELGSVKESFKEAVVALRESISHVVHIEDVPAAQKYDGEYPRDLEIRYQKRILEKDAAGAMNCAEGFLNGCTVSRPSQEKTLRLKSWRW